MPKEAIDLDLLYDRIQKGEIIMDKPLINYTDQNNQEFQVFQDSGLNILLGNEGNGKTKFLTQIIIQSLDLIKEGDPRFTGLNILYIDTERPESQYSQSIKHIYEKTKMLRNDISEHLHFLSAMDLECKTIVTSIETHLRKYPNRKFIIILDHVLHLVYDMNNTSEATDIDQFMKRMISQGHIIIGSIHKPATGLSKGLGHIGSALQRLASFILEISNNTDGNGFDVKQIKSRISGKSNKVLSLKIDSNGHIDSEEPPIIKQKQARIEKEDNTEIADEILQDFFCLLYTSPSPRDRQKSRMPSSA